MGAKCLRGLLVFLHMLIGLGSGFFCLYTEFFKDGTSSTCLPNLMDHWDHPIQFKNGLPVLCNSLVYGTGAICLLNFIMCVVNNCLLQNSCLAFFNTMLTTVYLAYSVMGSSVVTVYYMIWCDVLQQLVVGSNGCQDAATRYDVLNATTHVSSMSSNKSRMELQMAGMWALLPLIFLALLTYLFAFAASTEPERGSQIQYVVIKDETTPLLRQVSISTSGFRDSPAPTGQASASGEPSVQRYE